MSCMQGLRLGHGLCLIIERSTAVYISGARQVSSEALPTSSVVISDNSGTGKQTGCEFYSPVLEQ